MKYTRSYHQYQRIMVISYFKLAIQTCPFTAIKHPWKSSICVYISIEHIFQNIVNSCYVTWRVDLFWRWKTPPNTTKKYSFSHCCRIRECSTIISFIFWKGERGISCVRCIVLLFDITRSFDMMLVFQFHETGHQLDPHCRLMITNFHYVYAATGDETTLTLMYVMEHQVGVAGRISSDNIDLNDAKYLSIRML